MSYLVLVRHGQSEWNALGQFTGNTDVPLTELGISQAKAAAEAIKDIELHKGYTSELQRAHQTLRHILETNHRTDLPVTRHEALNERHYGIYEGLNIKATEGKLGKDKVDRIRHYWNEPVPEGETLKQAHDRVTVYYEQQILKDLKAGKNVILAAHRNVLRSIVKDLDKIPDAEIQNITLGNAEVNVYEIDPADGSVISKEIRASSLA